MFQKRYVEFSFHSAQRLRFDPGIVNAAVSRSSFGVPPLCGQQNLLRLAAGRLNSEQNHFAPALEPTTFLVAGVARKLDGFGEIHSHFLQRVGV